MTMQLYRTQGILDLSQVRQQKLLVLGLGSVGSLCVSNLAYPWRQIVLADPDTLEPENIERHLLGHDGNIGQPKVDGVKRWLVDRGMQEQNITAYHGNALDILDQHTDADLVLVAIDKRRVRDAINGWCYSHRIPAMYGGVYPKAVGGHIMVIPDPHQACYLCAEHLMGGDTQDSKEVNYAVDITQIKDESDMEAAVALRAPINAIATTMANLALDFLKGSTVESQVFIQVFAEWENIVMLPHQHPVVEASSHYAEQLKKTMLMPTEEVQIDGQWAVINRRNTTAQLSLYRWAKCPLHLARVELDQI